MVAELVERSPLELVIPVVRERWTALSRGRRRMLLAAAAAIGTLVLAVAVVPRSAGFPADAPAGRRVATGRDRSGRSIG